MNPTLQTLLESLPADVRGDYEAFPEEVRARMLNRMYEAANATNTAIERERAEGVIRQREALAAAEIAASEAAIAALRAGVIRAEALRVQRLPVDFPELDLPSQRDARSDTITEAQVVARTCALVVKEAPEGMAFNHLVRHAILTPSKVVKRVNGVDNLTRETEAVFEAQPHLLAWIKDGAFLEPGPRHMMAALELVAHNLRAEVFKHVLRAEIDTLRHAKTPGARSIPLGDVKNVIFDKGNEEFLSAFDISAAKRRRVDPTAVPS